MKRNEDSLKTISASENENPLLWAKLHNHSHVRAALIIDQLVKNNITDFYISPGMRNAPLLKTLERHPKAKLYLGIDERAQAFRALGNIKGSKRPAVLVCTSGTAVANYKPAVIEAYQTGHPLIVISADRPQELVYGTDNQSIPQTDIFGEFLKYKILFEAPHEFHCPAYISRLINHGCQEMNHGYPGPMHINCPFRDPLDSTPEDISDSFINKAKEILTGNQSSTQWGQSFSRGFNFHPDLIEKIKQSDQKVLVIGNLPPKTDLGKIKGLIESWNGKIYLDVTSSLKFSYDLRDQVIPTFDHPEVYSHFKSNPPELLLHLGGRTTSKYYIKFLKELKNVPIIHVNDSPFMEDPGNTTTFNFKIAPDDFSSSLLMDLKMEKGPIHNRNSKSSLWENFISKKAAIINQGPLTYPSLSKTIVEEIPEEHGLYLGNSTCIRSFDSYGGIGFKKNIPVMSHRGVSGIEGFMASALGFTEGQGKLDKPCTLVLGDISFFHDLNSLYLFKENFPPLIIVLINNFGGGIFTLLPIAKDKDVLPYLTTPHTEEGGTLVKALELPYKRVTDPVQFREVYTQGLSEGKTLFIEALINNEANQKIYDELKTVKM